MDVIVAIGDFIRHMRSIGYANATIESYVRGLMDFSCFLENKRIDNVKQVTRKTIEDYKLVVMSTSLAPESKALKLRPVKRLFEHLVLTDRLLINPALNIVEVTRRNRAIGTVLSVEQIKQLLSMPNMKTPVGIRNRAIIEVFYSTGMRLGELIGLQIPDVDLDGRSIFIRRGKGAKQRVVPLGKRAANILTIYLEKTRPIHDTGKKPMDALFLTANGKPITKEVIRMFLRMYKQAAGIDRSVSPHVFRRSCATHFLQNGADIRFVQQLLGHSSLNVTHYYTRVLPVELKHTHKTTHPGVDDAAH